MIFDCGKDERVCGMCGSQKDVMEYEAFFGRYMAAGPDGGSHRWCKKCKILQQKRLDDYNRKHK